MTAQELIDLVHEIDALEAAEAKAREESALRRGEIAVLRAKLEDVTRRSTNIATAAAAVVAGATAYAALTKRRESPRQDAIRRLVMRKPDANYRDVVMELYGEYNQKNVLNARSLVSNMKAAGTLAGEPGAWRATGNLGGKDGATVPMSPLEQDDDEGEHAA